MFNKPTVDLYNIDLIQAFYATNINNYAKYEPFVSNLRRVLGSGMAFSEGDEWKKKRRIISNVFHFGFLNSLLPKMNRLVDSIFSRFENSQADPNKNPGKLVNFFLGILGNFMMKFFFGGEVEGKTLDGVDVPTFLNKLVGDVNNQGFWFPAIVFGQRLLEWGLRATDRDISRRVELFK